jgi:hypothetical protein
MKNALFGILLSSSLVAIFAVSFFIKNDSIARESMKKTRPEWEKIDSLKKIDIKGLYRVRISCTDHVPIKIYTINASLYREATGKAITIARNEGCVNPQEYHYGIQSCYCEKNHQQKWRVECRYWFRHGLDLINIIKDEMNTKGYSFSDCDNYDCGYFRSGLEDPAIDDYASLNNLLNICEWK